MFANHFLLFPMRPLLILYFEYMTLLSSSEHNEVFSWKGQDIVYPVSFTTPGLKDLTVLSQNNISAVTQVSVYQFLTASNQYILVGIF